MWGRGYNFPLFINKYSSMLNTIKDNLIAARQRYNSEQEQKIVSIISEYFTEELVDYVLDEDFSTLESDLIRKYDNSALENNTITDSDYDDFYETYHVSSIIIRFPKVRITNEYDEYRDITELYAKILINGNKTTKGFLLGRSEFTYNEFVSNYAHSHIAYNRRAPEIFYTPCLGKGPIKSTIIRLKESPNDNIWKLFCLELDKYIHTESISGVPYRRLSDVSKRYTYKYNYLRRIGKFSNGITEEEAEEFALFTKHIIQKKLLNIVWNTDHYDFGHTDTELALIITNEYIKWHNTGKGKLSTKYLTDRYRLEPVIKLDGIIYKDYTDSDLSTITTLEGTILWKFKGNPVKFHIRKDAEESSNTNNSFYLLNYAILNKITTSILLNISYYYGICKSDCRFGTTVKFI